MRDGSGKQEPPPGAVEAVRCWLGTEESNPHIQIQNLLSYH